MSVRRQRRALERRVFLTQTLSQHFRTPLFENCSLFDLPNWRFEGFEWRNAQRAAIPDVPRRPIAARDKDNMSLLDSRAFLYVWCMKSSVPWIISHRTGVENAVRVFVKRRTSKNEDWRKMATHREVGVGDFVLLDKIDLENFMKNLELRWVDFYLI